MRPVIALLLAALAAPVPAADGPSLPEAAAATAPAARPVPDGHRVTMKDGRVLEGIYDADAGTLTLIGAASGVLTLRQADVAGVEPVVLAKRSESADGKRLRLLRAERTGAIAAIYRLTAELGEHPEDELAAARRELAELPAALARERERATRLGDQADEYRRQVALMESTTTTTGTSEAIPYGPGVVALPPVGGATVVGNGASVTTTTTHTVRAEAARAELAKLEAQVAAQRETVAALEARQRRLERRELQLTEQLAVRDRHQARLAELEALLK